MGDSDITFGRTVERRIRHPNQRGFDMSGYARLVFALNHLPPQIFIDPAVTKRVAIVEFNQQVSAKDKDTDFAAKMIASELPGILNWIIKYGLKPLLETGNLDPPQCVVARMERLQVENEPVSGWLAWMGWCQGHSHSITQIDAYPSLVQFCKDNGYQSPGNKEFSARLRDFGHTVEPPNGDIGNMIYYSKTPPPSQPKDDSADDSEIIPSESPENTGLRNDSEQRNENSGRRSKCKNCIHRVHGINRGGQCRAEKVQGAHPDCPDFASGPPLARHLTKVEEVSSYGDDVIDIPF